MRLTSLLTSVALTTGVIAQNITNCVGGGVCYAVNIPASTASSGSGDIYIHVSGPSTLQWIGIGQGSQMAGANIFMIYSNSAGDNVTVSPRLGTGERQPSTSGSTSQITLLEGSGIQNGNMTANFKCANCNSWAGGTMDFKSTTSSWIWAYRSGQAIRSNDISANLQQHSQYGTMSLNLQSATGGSSTNPFVGVAASQGTTTNTGSNNNNNNNDTGTTNNSSNTSGSKSRSAMILTAHGIVMGVAFAVLYPLGAISIRLLSFRSLVWLHAGWMAFTYLIVLVGMGLGIYIAKNKELVSTPHATIGLVVVAALILQPITGFIHHKAYKQTGGPTKVSPVHVWWGRVIVTLGIVNGGLGLKLVGNTRNGEIAYGVVAGVMWITWMAVVIFKTTRTSKRGSESDGSREEMHQHRSN